MPKTAAAMTVAFFSIFHKYFFYDFALVQQAFQLLKYFEKKNCIFIDEKFFILNTNKVCQSNTNELK